jgi:putative ATPase
MKELGYGEEYKYAHDYNNNFAEQEFLPEALQNLFMYLETIQRKQHQEFLKPLERQIY